MPTRVLMLRQKYERFWCTYPDLNNHLIVFISACKIHQNIYHFIITSITHRQINVTYHIRRNNIIIHPQIMSLRPIISVNFLNVHKYVELDRQKLWRCLTFEMNLKLNTSLLLKNYLPKSTKKSVYMNEFKYLFTYFKSTENKYWRIFKLHWWSIIRKNLKCTWMKAFETNLFMREDFVEIHQFF